MEFVIWETDQILVEVGSGSYSESKYRLGKIQEIWRIIAWK